MTKYRNKTIFSSFKYAFRGIFIAVKTQKNTKAAFAISIAVLTTAILMGFSHIEIALIFIAIGFVIFAELTNTTIEYVVDTYFGNKYSEIAKISKDVSAGTVLIAIINAAIIGSILFLPKLVELFLR